MTTKKYKGIPYHLWNPYTQMDRLVPLLGVGPTIVTRGEGNYVYNGYGERYLISNSCTWNFAIGYGREEIIEAVTRQMHELPFASSWGVTHPRAIELAAKLVEITSGNFAHVYLASNGSEAVETAIKLARQYHRQSHRSKDRGRYKIISLRGSYHGYAYGAMTLSGSAKYEEKFGPLVPGFVAIDPPYCFRCPYKQNAYPDCGLLCAEALEKAILAEGPETVAAFLLEPIMGEFGVIVPPPEYYRRIGEISKKYGLLLIADEVTTGFGRTGKLFATQDWDPQPDILCLGKAISGGYLPLAATLTTEEIYQRFLGEKNFFRHGSTNSGHPVCAAVGLAAIDIIIREKLPENAAMMGACLKSRLTELMKDHPIIGEVRGAGLMIAIDLVKNPKTKETFSSNEIYNFLVGAIMHGILLSYSEWGLSLFPPLTLDEAGVDEIVQALDKSLYAGIVPDMKRTARLLKEVAKSRRSKD